MLNNKEKEILIEKTKHLTCTLIELINNVDHLGVQVGALSLTLKTVLVNSCNNFEESIKTLNHIRNEIEKSITLEFKNLK